MSPYCEWCAPLRKTFSRFPSGWAAVALLVLRLVIGAIAFAEATLIFAGTNSPLVQLTAGCAAVGGLALLFGFLTPVVSGLIAVEAATMLLAQPTLRLLDSPMALFEFIAMAAVLAVLGPGALSIDARLFGLREVAISDRRPPDP